MDTPPPLCCSQAQRQRGQLTPVDRPEQVHFNDVAVSFSAEEWAMLEEWQKELYEEVMHETCALLFSLGKAELVRCRLGMETGVPFLCVLGCGC